MVTPLLPDDPRHGTYAGAIAHWKAGEQSCESCCAAGRRTRKQNELNRLSGRPGLIPLGERAWKIVNQTPRNQLALSTGMLHERLHRYDVAGPEKLVHRTTRDRILVAGQVPVWTPIGVQRRLQALAAIGWSCNALAERGGLHATSLGALRRRENPKHVRLAFAVKVLALYDELHMTLPEPGRSVTETRSDALRRGWLPPLAWEDIDDPNELPVRESRYLEKDENDPVVVERRLAGDHTVRTSYADRQEIVRRCHARGLSDGDAADLTGLSSQTVFRIRRDLGLPALFDAAGEPIARGAA